MRWRLFWLSPLCLLAACGDGGTPTDAALTGRVVTTTGEGVAAVLVRVTGTSVQTVTDATGAWRLAGAPAGNWTVSAESESGGRLRFAESALFFYNGRSVQTVPDLVLREATADRQPGRLSGTVVFTDGSPVIGAQVRVTGGGRDRVVRTGVTGGWWLDNVAPGTYALAATATATDGTPLTGQRNAVLVSSSSAGRLVQNADLVVAPADRQGSLTGLVTAAGQPVAGAMVDVAWAPAGGLAVHYQTLTSTLGEWFLAGLPSTADVTVTITAGGFATSTTTARARAGQIVTVNRTLDGQPQEEQQPPTNLDALATTLPEGVALRQVEAARQARLVALGGRAARFTGGSGGRLAPPGSRLQVAVAYRPANRADTAGQVLYRSHDERNEETYLPVGHSLSPATSRLVDQASALSVQTTFFYRLTSRGARGNESRLSDPVEVYLLPPLTATVPPDGQTNVARERLRFGWSNVAGARAYQVLLFADAPEAGQPVLFTSPPVIAEANDYTYDGPALEADREYWWLVVAVDHVNPTRATAESYSGVRRFRTTVD